VVRGFCGFSDRTETIVTNLPDYAIDGVPTPTIIHLPLLPALTTLVIYLCVCDPLLHLTNILCSIGSAPALTSIDIIHTDWDSIVCLSSTGLWVDVDRWLSRIAKDAAVKGGLTLTLRRCKSVRDGFLPGFRASGGKIKVGDSVRRRRRSRTRKASF